MRIYIGYVIIMILVICSCNSVRVNEESYTCKSFVHSKLDQTVQLSEYASPNQRVGRDSSKVVIFCASGGGLRAAAFTIGIMLELEKLAFPSLNTELEPARNVLNEIDYFSTVSGGGWGVSSFIAYQYQKQKYSTAHYQNAITLYNNSLVGSENKCRKIDSFPTFNSFEKYLANRADFRYQIPLILAFSAG